MTQMTTEEQTAGGETAAESTTEPSAGPENDLPVTLELDQVFETLKNQRRRLVLDYLRERDGRAEVGELSRAIAAAENDKPPAAVTSDERKRAYVGLYQCHLPKMDDMGIVHFEKKRGRVELEDHADALFPYLDLPETDETRDRWHVAYAGVAAGGVVTFLVALGLAASSPWLLAPAFALVVLALSVTAALHVRSERR